MVKIDLDGNGGSAARSASNPTSSEFPELGSPGDVSADLIQAEYEVRRQFGAPVALEDYLRRFPHQAAELARLIAAGGCAARHSSAAAAPRSSAGPETREIAAAAPRTVRPVPDHQTAGPGRDGLGLPGRGHSSRTPRWR